MNPGGDIEVEAQLETDADGKVVGYKVAMTLPLVIDGKEANAVHSFSPDYAERLGNSLIRMAQTARNARDIYDATGLTLSSSVEART